MLSSNIRRTAALLSFLVCTSLALSWIPSATAAASVDEDEESPLALAMDELQAGQRRLRKLVSDPAQKDECVQVVRNMQRNAIDALSLAPAAPETLAGSAADAYRIGYKKKIVQLVDELLSLELAVIEGRTDDATGHYKALGAHKKEGHDTYQAE